jgi:Methylase of chemotaxis methyl-accepting proteins
VAMLLSEYARSIESPPRLQIFATDLDEDAIRVARDGLYPPAIAADVSEERLRRFFTRDSRGYRIGAEIRESIIFAGHDLLKDAPFSRLDLVTCRNLFIYLNPDAQRRALEIIHFALRPRGRLFLGVSETAAVSDHLFRVVDKKHRIFESRPAPERRVPQLATDGALVRSLRCTARARRSAPRRWPGSALPAMPPSSRLGRAPKRSGSARGASCTCA